MKKNFLIVATAFIIALFALTVLGLTPEFVAAAANSSDAGISSAYPEWQLIVTGSVDNLLNLSWTEIVALPQSTVNAELICVDWPDQVLMSGNWTGVPLRFLLELAGISPQAMKVGFHATDGFSTDLTIETAMREDIILAYEINGEPLGDEVRLVVPGKWGYKWIHHVANIVLYSDDFLGHYESRGFSDEADVNMPSPPSRMIPEFQSWIILPLFLFATIVLTIYKKYMNKFGCS
ncbi:molybdopterin-dependent oxidoreductase [Candidatus Bathyarchaeota archaeon]|nr:molybdopterin-dependent oxidoreductase [Candidatus Bathyarchaeota archaeon]